MLGVGFAAPHFGCTAVVGGQPVVRTSGLSTGVRAEKWLLFNSSQNVDSSSGS
jgi:hypothetical protein